MQVEAYEGSFEKEKQAAELAKALQGVQLAIIPAGVPRKPGMTRDDLFNINAGAQSMFCARRLLGLLLSSEADQ